MMLKRKRVPLEGRGLAITVLLAALATLILSSLILGASNAKVPTPIIKRERFAIEWAQDQVAAREAARQAALPRVRLIWQIDTWLSQRGSPMVGMGECYVENQERTGIPATLSVGIAEAESTSGMACYNNPPGGCSHNAFGMVGPEYRNGFPTWEAGITANFDYLVHYFGRPQTMHDCPGYCVGDGTMQTVDDVQAAINRLDASWIQ